ncbi:pectinesterase inhibitor 5-like [Quercus lobata]|uniref:pectinesterase inhibitor 5-like n=1 Tax=Quercus lobata TaxID=97700 RepID=UPI0012484CB1|nr:pectinesterase inhibitor 5-like [Quercus lobata]
MASPINCLSILVIPLLVTSLFYQVSVGQKLTDDDLRSLCQKTTDSDFCFSTLKADPRTFLAAGDLHHLGLVSIAIVIDTVQVEVDEIPYILRKLGDRVDRSRMENCQYDYNNALKIMRDASGSVGQKNYNGAKSLTINAANGLAACDNSYKEPPVRTSPIADALTKVLKKCNIAVVVFNALTGT